jgi:hypothetical protein
MDVFQKPGDFAAFATILERRMSGDLKEGARSIDDQVIRSLTRFLRAPAALGPKGGPKRTAASRKAGAVPR